MNKFLDIQVIKMLRIGPKKCKHLHQSRSTASSSKAGSSSGTIFGVCTCSVFTFFVAPCFCSVSSSFRFADPVSLVSVSILSEVLSSVVEATGVALAGDSTLVTITGVTTLTLGDELDDSGVPTTGAVATTGVGVSAVETFTGDTTAGFVGDVVVTTVGAFTGDKLGTGAIFTTQGFTSAAGIEEVEVGARGAGVGVSVRSLTGLEALTGLALGELISSASINLHNNTH